MDVTIPCVCGRHETDTVTLRDTLDFRAASTVRNAIGLAKIEDDDVSEAEILAILREQYILVGVEGWTLMNGKGRLEVSKAAIRAHLLTDIEAATAVAEAADELYSAKVVLPLLKAASTSSPRGPMAAPTSAKRRGARRNPKPSSPSSTASTPTADTVTTTSPPAGGSST